VHNDVCLPSHSTMSVCHGNIFQYRQYKQIQTAGKTKFYIYLFKKFWFNPWRYPISFFNVKSNLNFCLSWKETMELYFSYAVCCIWRQILFSTIVHHLFPNCPKGTGDIINQQCWSKEDPGSVERGGGACTWCFTLIGTFCSATNPEYELRATSSLSALAAFISGRFVLCVWASAGFLVGKYERRKSFLNASNVSPSYFSNCTSYPLNMSGITWH
jgi:hypothetical protein